MIKVLAISKNRKKAIVQVGQTAYAIVCKFGEFYESGGDLAISLDDMEELNYGRVMVKDYILRREKMPLIGKSRYYLELPRDSEYYDFRHDRLDLIWLFDLDE